MDIRRSENDPRHSPVLIRGDLVRDGWTDKAIARQVRGGAWVRLRRGAYLDRRAWLSLDRRGHHEMLARAVLKQAKTDLVLSHLSALTLYDLETWDIAFDSVHVTREDRHSGRFGAGVRQHRGLVQPGDVLVRHGVPVMSPTRLAIEMTTCLDAEHALVVIDQLLHRRLTTKAELAARYDESMECWPDTLLTASVLGRSEGRHESVGETRVDDLFKRQQLPELQPQYEVRDSTGAVVARLDFALPAHRAYVEFDGRQKYAQLVPDQQTPADVIMAEKAREKLVYDLLGWLCIRITWDDLAHPVRTAARIRAQLAGRLVA